MSKLNDKLFMTNAELQTAIDNLIYFIGTKAIAGLYNQEAGALKNHLERLLEIQRERAALIHNTPKEEQSDMERRNSDYYSQLTADLMTKKGKSVFNKGV